jgi:hypothetical protein
MKQDPGKVRLFGMTKYYKMFLKKISAESAYLFRDRYRPVLNRS